MNDDKKLKTNIFGMTINTDKEMEEDAPNLDISNEEEVEQLEFNPFIENKKNSDKKTENNDEGVIVETFDINEKN